MEPWTPRNGYIEVKLADGRTGYLAVCDGCMKEDSCLTFCHEYVFPTNASVAHAGGRFTGKKRVMCPWCIATTDGLPLDQRAVWWTRRYGACYALLEQHDPWTWPLWDDRFPPPRRSEGGQTLAIGAVTTRPRLTMGAATTSLPADNWKAPVDNWKAPADNWKAPAPAAPLLGSSSSSNPRATATASEDSWDDVGRTWRCEPNEVRAEPVDCEEQVTETAALWAAIKKLQAEVHILQTWKRSMTEPKQ
jgi:hypothetical protein